jgi:hypothetical protein
MLGLTSEQAVMLSTLEKNDQRLNHSCFSERMQAIVSMISCLSDLFAFKSSAFRPNSGNHDIVKETN